MIPFFVLGLLLFVNLPSSEPSEAVFGVCHKPGLNQPSATEVVDLLEKQKINQIRLFEPNKEILEALKGKTIEVMLGVPNSAIIPLSNDSAGVEAFVRTNIKSYFPEVKIKYLVVGTDVSPDNENFASSLFLFNTLQNFQNELSKEGLNDIKLTSAFDTTVLVDRTLYTSNESFVAESTDFFEPILKLFSRNGSPFLVNIYPYYAHILNPKGLSLEYALGKDSNRSLFDTMVDAMYSALDKAGYKSMEIVVSETGWPSAGGVDASVENQKTFVNLIENMKNGTPEKGKKPIAIYLYSIFDEDVEGVPEIEKHFGLFTSKKELKFEFTAAFNSTSNSCFSSPKYTHLFTFVFGLLILHNIF